MPVTIITGLQWGDEGKGKMVDHLAENAHAVARFSGGANAGHTVEVDGNRIALHQLPSGLLRPGVLGMIGSACVLDPVSLVEEIRMLEDQGYPVSDRLTISGKVHLVHPVARYTEKAEETRLGSDSVGTTGRGIGPTYVMKFRRRGIRLEDAALPERFVERSMSITEHAVQSMNLGEKEAGDLRSETEDFNRYSLELVSMANDVSMVIHRILDSDGTLIAEGAQGTLLDVDHGTYPFVTSSNCVSAAAATGSGVAPSKLGSILGIAKAYLTRVGAGPFPTELDDEIGKHIQTQGNEFGTVTGRPRIGKILSMSSS